MQRLVLLRVFVALALAVCMAVAVPGTATSFPVIGDSEGSDRDEAAADNHAVNCAGLHRRERARASRHRLSPRITNRKKASQIDLSDTHQSSLLSSFPLRSMIPLRC